MTINKKTILAVGAHPDDIEFGASATVAGFVAKGWEAYYLLCTDGSRGSDDPQMTHKKLAKIRRDEQIAAGKVLGIKDIFFLTHPDTQLVCDLALKEEIVRVIRTVRPQIVITMNPTFYFSQKPLASGYHMINHTDHRAASLATLDAVFPLCRDALTFPEHAQRGLKPHIVEELWLIELEEKKHVVDVTKTLALKLQALECHVSQFDDFASIKKRVTERALAIAKGEDFKYGENFTRLILPAHRK